MELSEVISKKENLEVGITKLIMEFEKTTNLKVSDLGVFRPIPYTGGFSQQEPVVITVKVEI